MRLAWGYRERALTRSGRRGFLYWGLPWLVLALGLGATHALWRNAHQDAALALEAEFQFWANKVVYNIESRLKSNVQLLRGVVGLFDASESVARPEFRAYVAALRLEERYPGIQGVGFSLFIPSDQKAAHIAAMRQEGFPDYTIRPPGEREFYTSVVYIEPFSGRNLQAFGYDMSPEPVRWTAAARARDENRETLSGKVTLQQETATDIQPGFLIFAPVYRQNVPNATLEERRANLMGWVFSPLRIDDLMRSLLGTVEFDDLRSVLDMEIYDGAHLSRDTLIFDTDLEPDFANTHVAFRAVRSIEFGGHRWSVLVTSNPAFDARLRSEKPSLIAMTGSAGSLLLALLIGVMASGQARITAAFRETARTNEKLVASEARFRSYFEHPLIGIAITSLEKGWIEVNDRACEILGYSREELRQKTWAELTHPADLTVDVVQFERVLAGEVGGYSLEKRFVRGDGHIVSTDLSVACVREASGRPGYFVALLQDIT